jgi:hypothetical protein
MVGTVKAGSQEAGNDRFVLESIKDASRKHEI